MLLTDPWALIAVAVALALGGCLKGATGAGAPVVAVPVMASFLDVRLAVIVMVLPNIATNLWQSWHFRRGRLGVRFVLPFAGGGAAGAALGTVLLANLAESVLELAIAALVAAYIGLRLARPDLALARRPAERLAGPVGLAAGVLQGAAGLSAPVSLSFLNAMKLERAAFIPTVSVFFLAMSLVQAGTLATYGLLSRETMVLGLLAIAPLFAGIPLGAWLARSISPRSFDRIVLVMLAALAVKLTQAALTGAG